MFGAHLDSMVGTITGTYDDGSGIPHRHGAGRAFKDVPTHRTLVFSWYNGEEEGALGSAEHAAAFKAAGKKVSAYLGFDMVGIAWPLGASWSPVTRTACASGAAPVTRPSTSCWPRSTTSSCGFPKGKRMVSLEGVNVRNSDEASWADAGYPTMRWAGQRKAADYPGYHLPNDDIARSVRAPGAVSSSAGAGQHGAVGVLHGGGARPGRHAGAGPGDRPASARTAAGARARAVRRPHPLGDGAGRGWAPGRPADRIAVRPS